MAARQRAIAPDFPKVRLCLGIAGHRAIHRSYGANITAIVRTFAQVLDIIQATVDAELGAGAAARTRVHTLLADGADQLAACEALRRGWEVVAPLPVGAALNCAINARPESPADARLILAGKDPADSDAARRAAAIRKLYGETQLFELRDADGEIENLFVGALTSDTVGARSAFDASISARVALAARIVLEQSDIVLAIWDGVRTSSVGGTGHTVQAALDMGAPIVLIDPENPEQWRFLRAPEALLHPSAPPPEGERQEQLRQLVRDALRPIQAHSRSRHHAPKGDNGLAAALSPDHWRASSRSFWHTYRRIETLFGGGASASRYRRLRQIYEPPDTYATGGGAPIVKALQQAPGADRAFADRVAGLVLPRFAWSDGIASYLSDKYRSGMIINFILSALAVIGGLAYLPLVGSELKWTFAAFELVLLAAILVITHRGQSQRWHGRWFETRRAAEYLRHAPILLALGAARAPGRWPRGADAAWPEWYARHTLREVGLPRCTVTADYLRHCLSEMLDRHVVQQRDYHQTKVQRLTNVHHNLDHLSERLFQLAVAVVALFLVIQMGAWTGWIGEHTLKDSTKIFTFLGVALPTLGGAIAGVRYFGDFERFAAISEVTAQKLDAVHERIRLLLRAPDGKLDYASVANLAHAADDIVVGEIENWQAVFGGKQITVPV